MALREWDVGMDEATELRRRAASWRRTAEVTRAELAALRSVGATTWRGGSADVFREVLGRRISELRELADREDALAAMLDRVAAVVEQAA